MHENKFQIQGFWDRATCFLLLNTGRLIFGGSVRKQDMALESCTACQMLSDAFRKEKGQSSKVADFSSFL